MKRLLLSLCLVSAVFPGHNRLALQAPLGPPTSAEHLVEVRAVLSRGPAMQGSMSQPQNSGVERTAVKSLAMVNQDTESIAPPKEDNHGAPLPTPGENSEAAAPLAPNEEANWVVVIRGATEHSGPSVSAPTVRYYPVGTELHLIGYEQGWFQVLDPVTSQRGWIYEKYYLQAIRGPGQMVALQEPAKRQQKPTLHVRRAKSLAPRPAKKIQPLIASAPRYRYETVASILDRALRP